jgi:hypothetical protein
VTIANDGPEDVGGAAGAGAIGRGGANATGGTTGSGGAIDSGGANASGGAFGTDGASSTASLAGNPDTLPFGSVPIGQKSAAQTVLITNQGKLSSGALVLSVDSTDFAIDDSVSGDCSAGLKLAGGAACGVHIVFTPSTGGARNGTLTVSGSPGGAVNTSLSGIGATPGVLTMSAKAIDFASTPVGTSVTRTITVTNAGQIDVTGLQYAVADGGAAQFTHAENAAGDCGTTIAAGASCTLHVTFVASVRGTYAGAITLTPANTTAVSATLAGGALGPAILSGDLSTADFDDQEVGTVSSKNIIWTITNTGDQATSSVPSLSNSDPVNFSITTTCNAVLQPRASCTVTVSFKPSVGGMYPVAVVAKSGDSSATLELSGRGMVRLTISKAVGASACADCSVQSGETARLIDCGTTCSALYAPDTTIKLRATTTNGSGHWFSGWSGADTLCKGPVRDCSFSLSQSGSVTLNATFSVISNNLIFHGVSTVSTAAGSAKAYDTICNTLASAAGINNTSGTGYAAWVSDANSLATARVFPTASTQGWVRMDGRVFATTQVDLLNNSAVLNPILFDEMGNRGYGVVITGTNADGTLSEQNCNNWTSKAVADGVLVALTTGGPIDWTSWGGDGCSYGDSGILCMGVTSSTP